MIAAIPARPARLHLAFALRPEDAEEARRAARRVVEDGPLAASPAVGAWLSRAEPVSHDRKSPLDPRIDGLVARLRAAALFDETAAKRDAALAAWSPAPRDVWRTPERTVAYRALRTLRLVELAAPAIIVESELDGLGAAIAALDGPPPRAFSAPSVDPGAFVELRYAIAAHARADLSLEGGLAVFDALRTKTRFHDGPERALAAGEPLAPVVRATDVAEPDVRAMLDDVRAFRVVVPSTLASAAEALAAELAAIPARSRGKVSRTFDEGEAAALRGGDYVASAESRLREIAAAAHDAGGTGHVIVAAIVPSRE